jgi:hypothetical protein
VAMAFASGVSRLLFIANRLSKLSVEVPQCTSILFAGLHTSVSVLPTGSPISQENLHRCMWLSDFCDSTAHHRGIDDIVSSSQQRRWLSSSSFRRSQAALKDLLEVSVSEPARPLEAQTAQIPVATSVSFPEATAYPEQYRRAGRISGSYTVPVSRAGCYFPDRLCAPAVDLLLRVVPKRVPDLSVADHNRQSQSLQ